MNETLGVVQFINRTTVLDFDAVAWASRPVNGPQRPAGSPRDLAACARTMVNQLDIAAPKRGIADGGRQAYAAAVASERGGTGLEGLVDPSLIHGSGEGALTPRTLRQLQKGEDCSDEMSEAIQRSKQYLNGVPCFLLEAYCSCDLELRPAERVLEEIGAIISDASATSGHGHSHGHGRQIIVPKKMFDELMVSSSHVLTPRAQ